MQNKAKDSLEERLPLVVEIMPGQAREGLVHIFEPDHYDEMQPDQLVHYALSSDTSIEDRSIKRKIEEQMQGGVLLYKGEEAEGYLLDKLSVEETAQGERYMYMPLRVIKPQEGG